MKKATQVEKEARTNEVLSLLLKGASRGDILQFVSTRWGGCNRQADWYIAKARAILNEQATAYREQAFAEHVAARRALRMQAHANEDWRLVLECLRDEAKMLGLYEYEILNRVQELEQNLITVVGHKYDYHTAIAALEPKDGEEHG